jgi:hypothetical protein
LGQRKKNQRKTRNKKRCQERRASESENSEGEAEKERERERKTDDEKEKSEIGLEEKLSNSCSSGDSSPIVQESRESNETEEDASKPSHAELQPLTAGNPSKQLPNKGKKKNRKGAPTLQSFVSGIPQIEFGSDLIFDLDM